MKITLEAPPNLFPLLAGGFPDDSRETPIVLYISSPPILTPLPIKKRSNLFYLLSLLLFTCLPPIVPNSNGVKKRRLKFKVNPSLWSSFCTFPCGLFRPRSSCSIVWTGRDKIPVISSLTLYPPLLLVEED